MFKTKIEESSKTLRDEFALAAMPGIMNKYEGCPDGQIAFECYSLADAMLKEREKNE